MTDIKETFHRGRATACLQIGRGMYWLFSTFFQDKINSLREELGPSVFNGLMDDRNYLLITTQLEIIARVTGIDFDFWHEGQELVNHRRGLTELSKKARDIF